MKGFLEQGFVLIFVIFLGVFSNSVSRCDAQRSIVGANSIKLIHACEDHIMHLSCPHRSLSVNIVTAKYGRNLSKKNICSPTEEQVIKDCGENNVKPNIDKLCVGKTECSFNVDNRNLGAFCVNIYKYLTVVFRCVVKPTTKEPPTTTPTTTPVPTTNPTTTSQPALIKTTEPNTNFTNNSTFNSTTEPDTESVEVLISQNSPRPRTRKPINEVYERDVFARSGNGALSSLSSGHYTNICKFVVSLLVFVVFDACIFRVT